MGNFFVFFLIQAEDLPLTTCITYDTENFGGITNCRCICSSPTCQALIPTPFHLHINLSILFNSCLIDRSESTFPLYLGHQTT